MSRRALAAGLLALAGCRGAVPPPAPPPPTSILLITADTLRADRVGAYGDAQARTPVMDRLARGGVLFERAYAVAPLTLPSHVSMLTGLLPPTHGVRGNVGFALGAGPPTLAEKARAAGLHTGAFVGGFPLARRFGLGRGFEHYDDAFDRAPGLHYEFAERRAEVVVAAARAWLAQNPGPAFLWVHLFDPHAPYDPPPAFAGPDPYRGEVAAMDAALGGLLQAWDARGGPSLVALAADHGEAFGEHGEESHSLFAYDTTLQVPLLLRGSGIAPRRVAEAVSTVDLAHTLQARLPAGGTPLPGRDLLGPRAPQGLYAETLAPRLEFGWSDLRTWREDGWKYVRAPRPELFHVREDAGEERDLAKEQPAKLAALEAALQKALGAAEATSRAAPDPDAAARLQSLGYVQALAPLGGSGADPKDRREVARLIARAAGPFPDHAAVVRAYQPIATLDPQNPLVNLRLGEALLRSGRAREAVAPLQRVVATRPQSAQAYVGLATALAGLGRLEEAQEALEGALEAEPHDAQAHFNLGELARARGDVAGARAHYEQALSDPVTRGRAQMRLREVP